MFGRVCRFFAAGAAAMLVVSPVSAHHAPGPIKVAAVLSLTGPYATMGQSELRALEFGIEQLNRAGGLLTHQVELAARDDAGEAAQAEAHARALSAPEHADILIGGTTTATSQAIAAVAQKAGIPFIALGGARSIVSPTRKWVYKTAPTEELAVQRILEDMKASALSRVAVLYEDTDFGRAAAKEMRTLTDPGGLGAKRYAVALAIEVAFRVSGEGLAAAMGRLGRARDLQAVAVLGAGEGMAVATRWIRDGGIKVPVYHSHGSAVGEFAAQAGKAAEGVRMAAPPLLAWRELPAGDPQRAVVERFAAAYRAKYSEEPSSFAGYARDALAIAVDAIGRVSSTDFAALQRGLDTTRGLVGVTGTYNFWASDHTGIDAAALRIFVLKDGAWRLER